MKQSEITERGRPLHSYLIVDRRDGESYQQWAHTPDQAFRIFQENERATRPRLEFAVVRLFPTIKDGIYEAI